MVSGPRFCSPFTEAKFLIFSSLVQLKSTKTVYYKTVTSYTLNTPCCTLVVSHHVAGAPECRGASAASGAGRGGLTSRDTCWRVRSGMLPYVALLVHVASPLVVMVLPYVTLASRPWCCLCGR